MTGRVSHQDVKTDKRSLGTGWESPTDALLYFSVPTRFLNEIMIGRIYVYHKPLAMVCINEIACTPLLSGRPDIERK